MVVFLLCIPLVIFAAAEGSIIYLLINRITETLLNEGFSSDTMIDEAVPSLTAILYVLGLILIAGIVIWVYIRFIIVAAVKRRKEESQHLHNNYGEDREEDEKDENGSVSFIEELSSDEYDKPGKSGKSGKSKKRQKKTKSKKPKKK